MELGCHLVVLVGVKACVKTKQIQVLELVETGNSNVALVSDSEVERESVIGKSVFPVGVADGLSGDSLPVGLSSKDNAKSKAVVFSLNSPGLLVGIGLLQAETTASMGIFHGSDTGGVCDCVIHCDSVKGSVLHENLEGVGAVVIKHILLDVGGGTGKDGIRPSRECGIINEIEPLCSSVNND